MVLFILPFEIKKALEEWLAYCNGHAVDDGGVQGVRVVGMHLM